MADLTEKQKKNLDYLMGNTEDELTEEQQGHLDYLMNDSKLSEEQQGHLDYLMGKDTGKKNIDAAKSLKEGLEGEEKYTAFSVGQIKNWAQKAGNFFGNAWHSITDKDLKHGINDYSEYKKYNKALEGADQETKDNAYQVMAQEGIVDLDKFTQWKADEPDKPYEKYEQAVTDIKSNFDRKLSEALGNVMSRASNDSYKINALTKGIEKMNTQFGMFVDNFADIYKDTRDDSLLTDFNTYLREYENDIIKFTSRRADHLTTDNNKGIGAYYNTLNDYGMRQVANDISRIQSKYEDKFAQAAIKSNFGDSWEAFKKGNLISSVAELVGGGLNGINRVLDKLGQGVEEAKQGVLGRYDVVEELNHLNVYADDAGALEKTFGTMASWVGSIIDAAPTIAPALVPYLGQAGKAAKLGKVGKVATKIDDMLPVIFKSNRDLRALSKAEGVLTNGNIFRLEYIQELINDTFLFDVAFQQFMGRPLTDDDIAANFLINLGADALAVKLGSEGLKAFRTTLKRGDLVTEEISEEMYKMLKKAWRGNKSMEDTATDYFIGRSFEYGKPVEKQISMDMIKNEDETFYKFIREVQEDSGKTIDRITTFQPTGNDIIKKMQADLASRKSNTLQGAIEVGQGQIKAVQTLLKAYPGEVGTKTTLAYLKTLIANNKIDDKAIIKAINNSTKQVSVKKILTGIITNNYEQYSQGLKELEKNLGEVSKASITEALDGTIGNLLKQNPDIIKAGDVVNGYVKGEDGMFRSLIVPDRVLSADDFMKELDEASNVRIGKLEEGRWMEKIDDLQMQIELGEISPVMKDGRPTQKYDVTRLFQDEGGRFKFGLNNVSDWEAAKNTNPKAAMADRIARDAGLEIQFTEGGLKVYGGPQALDSLKRGMNDLQHFVDVPNVNELNKLSLKKNIITAYKVLFAEEYSSIYKCNIDAINDGRVRRGMNKLTSQEMKEHTKNYKTWLETLIEEDTEKSKKIKEHNNKVRTENKTPDETKIKTNANTEVLETLKQSIDGTPGKTVLDVEKQAAKQQTKEVINTVKEELSEANQNILNQINAKFFSPNRDQVRARVYGAMKNKDYVDEDIVNKGVDNITDIIMIFKDNPRFNDVVDAVSDWYGTVVNTPMIWNEAAEDPIILKTILSRIVYNNAESNYAFLDLMQTMVERNMSNAKGIKGSLAVRHQTRQFADRLAALKKDIKKGNKKGKGLGLTEKLDNINMLNEIQDYVLDFGDFEKGLKIYKEKNLKMFTNKLAGKTFNIAEMSPEEIHMVAEGLAARQMRKGNFYSERFFNEYVQGFENAINKIKEMPDDMFINKNFKITDDFQFAADSVELGLYKDTSLLGNLRNSNLGYTSVMHEFYHNSMRNGRNVSYKGVVKGNTPEARAINSAAGIVDLSKYGGSFFAYIKQLEDEIQELANKAYTKGKPNKNEVNKMFRLFNYSGTSRYKGQNLLQRVEENFSDEAILGKLKALWEEGDRAEMINFETYNRLGQDMSVTQLEELTNELRAALEYNVRLGGVNTVELQTALEKLEKVGHYIDRFRILSQSNDITNKSWDSIVEAITRDYTLADTMQPKTIKTTILDKFAGLSKEEAEFKVAEWQDLFRAGDIKVGDGITTANIKAQVLHNLEANKAAGKDVDELMDIVKSLDDDETVAFLDMLDNIKYTNKQYVSEIENEAKQIKINDYINNKRLNQKETKLSGRDIINDESRMLIQYTDGNFERIPRLSQEAETHMLNSYKTNSELVKHQKKTKDVPLIKSIKSQAYEYGTIGQEYIRILSRAIGDEDVAIDIEKILVGDDVINKFIDYRNAGGQKDFKMFCINRLVANVLDTNGKYHKDSGVLKAINEMVKPWQIHNLIDDKPTREIIDDFITKQLDGHEFKRQEKLVYYNVPTEDGQQKLYAQLVGNPRGKKYYKVTKNGSLTKIPESEGMKHSEYAGNIVKEIVRKETKVPVEWLKGITETLNDDELAYLEKAIKNYVYALKKGEISDQVMNDLVTAFKDTLQKGMGINGIKIEGFAPKQLVGMGKNISDTASVTQRVYDMKQPILMLGNFVMDLKRAGAYKGALNGNGMEALGSLNLNVKKMGAFKTRYEKAFKELIDKLNDPTQVKSIDDFAGLYKEFKKEQLEDFVKIFPEGSIDKSKLGEAIDYSYMNDAKAIKGKAGNVGIDELEPNVLNGKTKGREFDNGVMIETADEFDEELRELDSSEFITEYIRNYFDNDFDNFINTKYGVDYDENYLIKEKRGGELSKKLSINAGPYYLNSSKKGMDNLLGDKTNILAGRLRNMDRGFYEEGGLVGISNKYGVERMLGRQVGDGVVDKIMVKFGDGGSMIFGKDLKGNVINRGEYQVSYNSVSGIRGNNKLGIIQSIRNALYGGNVEVRGIDKGGKIIDEGFISGDSFFTSFAGKEVADGLGISHDIYRDVDGVPENELRAFLGLNKGSMEENLVAEGVKGGTPTEVSDFMEMAHTAGWNNMPIERDAISQVLVGKLDSEINTLKEQVSKLNKMRKKGEDVSETLDNAKSLLNELMDEKARLNNAIKNKDYKTASYENMVEKVSKLEINDVPRYRQGTAKEIQKLGTTDTRVVDVTYVNSKGVKTQGVQPYRDDTLKRYNQPRKIYLDDKGNVIKEELTQNRWTVVAQKPIYKVTQDLNGGFDEIANKYMIDEDVLGYELSDKWFPMDATFQDMLEKDIIGGPYSDYYPVGGNLNVVLDKDAGEMYIKLLNEATGEEMPAKIVRETVVNPMDGTTYVGWNLYFNEGSFGDIAGKKLDKMETDFMGDFDFDRKIGLSYNQVDGWKNTNDVGSYKPVKGKDGWVKENGSFKTKRENNQILTNAEYEDAMKTVDAKTKKKYSTFLESEGDIQKATHRDNINNFMKGALGFDNNESVKSLTNKEHYVKYEARRIDGVTNYNITKNIDEDSRSVGRILSLHNFDVIGNDPILVQLRGANKSFRAQFGDKLVDTVKKRDEAMGNLTKDDQNKVIQNLKDTLRIYSKKNQTKIMTLNVPGVGKEIQDILNDFTKVFYDAGWDNDVILSMINRPQSLDDILDKTFNSDFIATLGLTGLRTKDAVREFIYNIARSYDKPKNAYHIAQDFIGDPLGTSKGYKFMANVRDAYRFLKYSVLSPVSGTIMYINSAILGEPLLWGKKRGLYGFLNDENFQKIVENEAITNILERSDDIIANGNMDMYTKGLFVNSQLKNLANLVSKPGTKWNKILQVVNQGGIHSLYDMQKSGDVRKYAFAQALKKNNIYESQLPDLLKKVENGDIFKEEYAELWNKIMADTEEYYARFFSNGSTTATSRHKFSRAFGVNFLQGYVINRTDEMIQSVRKFGNFLNDRGGVKNLTWNDVTRHINRDNPELKSFLNNIIFSAKAGYYLDKIEDQDGREGKNLTSYFVSTNDYLSSLDATFFYRILSAPLNGVKAYNDYNDMAGEKGTVMGGVKVATYEVLSEICSQFFREGKFLNAISNTLMAAIQTGDLDFASTVAGVEFDKMTNSLGRFGLVQGLESYGTVNFGEESDIIGQMLLATDKTTMAGKEMQNIYDITAVDKWINNKIGDNAVTALGYLPVIGEVLKSLTNKGGFGFTEAKYKEMMGMFDNDKNLQQIYNGNINTELFSDEAINRIYNDFTAFNYPYKSMKSTGKHAVGSYLKGEDTTLNSMKEDVFVQNICEEMGISIEQFHQMITAGGSNNAKTTGRMKTYAAAEAAQPGSGKIVLSYMMANRLYQLEQQYTGNTYPSTADVPEDVMTLLKRQVVQEFAADEFVADRTSQYKVIREYVSEKNPEVFDTLYKNETLSGYAASLGFLEMLVRQSAKDGDVNAKYLKNVFSVMSKYMINDEARIGMAEHIASVIDNLDASQDVKDMALEGVLAGNIDIYNKLKNNKFYRSTHGDVLDRFEERIWGVMDRVDGYENQLTRYGKSGTPYTSQYGNGNKQVDDEFKKKANALSPLKGGNGGYSPKYPGGYTYNTGYQPKGKDLDYYFKLYEALIKDYSDKLVKSEGKKYPAEKIAGMTYKSGRSYGRIKAKQLSFPEHKRKRYSTKVLSNMPGASG